VGTATDLSGRGAVVTGGGRGIGAAVAKALAAAGAKVVVAARSGDETAEVAAAIGASGGEAHAATCDVTDVASVEALAELAVERLGAVDILVNNAGIASSGTLERIDEAEWGRILDVNASGTFRVTKALLPGMLARGWGRIVNVASIAGLAGGAYIAHYAASKHAVVGFTRALAVDVAAKGVTVNALCPGFVDTPMTDASIERVVAKTGLDAADARRRIEAMSPQNRLIEVDEVAFWTVVLCDERSRGVTGQAIAIDGGTLAR